jgi:hypothetical protein
MPRKVSGLASAEDGRLSRLRNGFSARGPFAAAVVMSLAAMLPGVLML